MKRFLLLTLLCDVVFLQTSSNDSKETSYGIRFLAFLRSCRAGVIKTDKVRFKSYNDPYFLFNPLWIYSSQDDKKYLVYHLNTIYFSNTVTSDDFRDTPIEAMLDWLLKNLKKTGDEAIICIPDRSLTQIRFERCQNVSEYCFKGTLLPGDGKTRAVKLFPCLDEE